MNKIYKVIYNKSKGCYTVVSELAKGKTKSQSRKTKTALTMAVVLGLSVGFMGTTFADGINISQTNSDGTVQQGNTVSGTNKILIGTEIKPHSTAAKQETGSIAIGDKIKYGGERSIAIGTDLKTSNDNSILIGSDMIGDAYSKQVIAIGNKIGNKDENNGNYNLGYTQKLIAIGNDVITAPLTSMENFNSVIIGNNSKVTGNNNIVLGNKSSDEKLMKQTTEYANEDENADPEDATIFILPNGSGFGGAVLNKKTGDGYLVIGNEDSSRRIAYVAAGVDDSDAANMEQLRSLAKNKISLGGDTGQTKKLELGVENLTAPNENRLKFNITGDGNYISTAASGTSVSTSFKTDQFVADQLPVTFVNADGKKLVKMKVTNGGATTEGFYVIDDLVDGKVSAGTDPVAPSDVFLSLANPTSTNPNKAGEPIKLLNIKNVLALSNMPTTMSNAAAFSSDNVRVVRNMLTGAQEQGITPDPNQTPFYSISGSDLYRPVTVGDLQAIASAGITFKATSGDEVVRRLGETLTIKGGGKVFNTDFSAKNITTKTDNNELIIGLKTAPDFKKITFHEGKASISNDSESNPTQFIFQGAQQADGTYSKMKLTNLADANIVANNSDAVTGGQIFSSLKTVSSDVIAIKANNANGQAVTPKMWLDGNTATNVFLTLNDRSITETKLADAAVTKDKIANNAVTTNKIADNSIPIGKLNTTLQTTINSIGNKLDASRAQFTISDSKTNSTINLNTETAPTIVVKSGNTSALQVALNSNDNTFTITPQTLTANTDVNTADTSLLKRLVTGENLKKAIEPKFNKNRAKFNIQDDSTTTKEINLDNDTAPTVRVKGDSSVIEVKFDNTDLKVSAKVADNTAANFVNNTNQNLLATPLGVKNYINSLLAPTSANDFGNTNNGGKLATAQGVVNYVNANKVKYFSVNTTQDWMGNPHNDGNANNDGARGENSLVIGRASSTQRQGSLFVGNGITDSGLGNGGRWTGFNGGFVTVVGNNNTIQRPQSMFPQVEEMGITVLGSMNNIIGRTTKVFGFNNNILGPANLGIGDNLTVNGTKGENVAIIMTSMNLNNGPSADREQGISGDGNVGIGSGVLITSKTQQAGTFPVKAVAIGYDTKVYAVDSIAIGRQALGEAQGGIALGSDARTTKQGATYNSEMIKTGYNPGNTAAPSNNNTWQANRSELSLGQYDGSTGQSSITRRIANVAAGVLDADAVNVAQLKQITLGVQDDTATTPNKLYMKLYDDTNKKVNLLNMVSDTDKNIKVTVVPDENKVKFGLKSELKGITSITNTAEGSTSTTGTTVNIGDTGLTLNDKKITGLTDGTIGANSKDAVTGNQIQNLINKVDNQIASNNNLAYVNEAGDELVRDGNKFYKKSDLTNLARANDGKYYNKTDVNPDGSLKDPANATPQTVDPQTPAYVSVINPDGTVAKATPIGNVKSALGLDNMPEGLTGTPITAEKAKTAVAGADGASGLLAKTGKDLYKVATLGDLQAVSMAGLTFTADETGKEIHRPLGTALKISATTGITDTNKADFTTTNLGTKIDTTNNVISIEMKKALTDINSITSNANNDLVLAKGGTNKPSITINDDGLKVTTGTGTTQSNIVIGKDGKISGVNPAEISSTSTDVVIGSQLQDLKDNLKFQVENIKSTMVYTDASGDRLIKDGDNFYKASAVEKDYALANDGKYYPKDEVDEYGNVKDNTAQAVNLQDEITGAGDKVDSSNVIISTVNPDGTTTSSTIIGNVKSGLGLENMNKTATGGTISNTDKQNGSGSTTITAGDARTSIAGTNKDGKGGIYNLSGNALHKVATVGDLQAVSMAGLTFTADETSKEIHRPLGTALKISTSNAIGTTDANNYTNANLGTKIDTTNNVISIEMKKALTNVNSITSEATQDLVLTKGGANMPSATINSDGLKVTTGTAPNQNNILIGKDGKITGLKDGSIAANSTDAVTGGQVFTALNDKANKDASNLVTNPTDGTAKTSSLSSDAQTNWATALGTGTIGSGDTANGGKATDNNLVTGKTVYDSIKDMVKYDTDKHNTITLGIPAGKTGATTTKITNLTDGDITNTSTDAVTGKQIKSIVDNVNTTINNLTSTMVYTDDAGNRLTKVGDKFYKTSAVSNYALANDGKYYEKSKVDPVTGAVENGANEVDLATTVTGDDQVAADKVITSAVNGSGSTTSAQTIGNIASGLGLDNMKVLDNGTQSNTLSTTITQDKAAKVIAGDNKDGKGGLLTKSGAELHKVATVGDLQALAMAGLTFTADEENKEIHRPLGTALKIVTGTAIISSPKAGAATDPNAKTPNEDKFTNANLGTRIDDADNVIGIQMKKDLTDINSITSTANTDLVIKKGGTDKPSITINDDGLKVTTGAAGTTQSNILIGKDGKISGLKDGTIATGSTDAVTGNQIAGLTVAYKSSTGGDTTAKTVTLTNGFDFKAGSGTTGTTGAGTDAEKTKSGIVIETKANGEIVIGLDEATRKKIDETSDEVVVVDGDNTTAQEDTKNPEAGKKKYKVNLNKDLTNVNSIASENGKDLTLNKKDGSKVVLGENGINLTGGSGTDAKTITINKDGTISGVTSGLKLDNTTPISKDAAISALNGTEDKTNPANSKPGLLGATGDALNNITTVKDLQAVAQAGLTFKTDGGEEIHRPLGSALSLTTGIKVNDSNKTNYEFANPNLGTKLNPATGTINFVFKSQPTFNGISFSGGPNGNVLNMNNQGQLFITKDGKDELLGINVKKFDGKSYFVPLNGTIEFKDTANVVADVSGKTESTLAPAGLTGGTGGTPSVASPTSGPAPLSTGSAFFDGVDTTTDAKPPASTTVDATVEWKIPDNAPIKITVDEDNMKDDQIVNKKYVDSKLAPIVNNTTNITNHLNKLGEKIVEVSRDSNAGTASALAAASIPQVLNVERRSLVGFGMGSYRGSRSFALGLSGTNRARDFVYKVTGTYDSRNVMGLSVGIGFSVGPKNHYEEDKERNYLEKVKVNDFNERLMRQQAEIETLKDFIKEMQVKHEAEMEALKEQMKNMQPK